MLGIGVEAPILNPKLTDHGRLVNIVIRLVNRGGRNDGGKILWAGLTPSSLLGIQPSELAQPFSCSPKATLAP